MNKRGTNATEERKPLRVERTTESKGNQKK